MNFGSDFLRFISLNSHRSFARFDLLALPANAVIDSAELQLNFKTLLVGPNDVEVGRANGAWDEATVTWNNQPAITGGGPVKTVTANGLYTFDVTALVQAWHASTVPNDGFAMRGNGGQQVVADSKETGVGPRLLITYRTTVFAGAQPDLGDAPDSSNHVGIPNTAYPGVAGNFPTVWSGTPANAAAGPRHENQTREGILGDVVSRENEADTGADEDTQNNILNGGADNANNDRGDEGWRNRNIKFFNCQRQTLTIRVSKANVAQLNRMYLNVWFDGERDGDWNGNALCTPPDEALQVPSSEWIVQDHFVDMAGIPAGGFVDINIDTETVLNLSPAETHWMRFTLSEERTVQNANGRADGRGPNPNSALPAYKFGETEDVFQKPPPPGAPGTLELQKRVFTGVEPVEIAGNVTYQILLRHNGGNQPIEAQIRDELLPLFVISPNLQVTSATGGAAPLQAELEYVPAQGGTPSHRLLKWRGTLAPGAEVKLTFDALVLPPCAPGQQTGTIRNVAEVRPVDGATISAEDSFSAKCFDYHENNIEIGDMILTDLDPSDVTPPFWSAKVLNTHATTATLGFFQLPDVAGLQTAAASAQPPVLTRVTFAPNERKLVKLPLSMEAESTDELTAPAPDVLTARVGFCFLLSEDNTCPDAVKFPQLTGAAPPISVTVATNDLGDAPDSSNHPGAPMAAYVNTSANFPTVFDPATGQPQGPRHRSPRPFHLGPQVSREAEADIGPDQDPLNNIVPPANDPDNDRFDDGVQPNLWNLNNCQITSIPVRVFISPQAAAWFQAQNKKGFLNVWLDGNRDGDWADGLNCAAGQDAVEHVVIDQQIDVAALGAGLHIINMPTKLVPWPAPFAQRPAWVRVTLSERESNKTLQFGAITYGNGRGVPQAFQTGETEDYLAHPEGVPGDPDLAVNLDGKLRHEGTGEQASFKIDYAYVGTRPASGATLTFKKPKQLRAVAISLLQAPGIPATDIADANGTITFKLPTLQPGTSSAITLRWAAFPTSVAGNLSAEAQIALSGDGDASNNGATAAVTRTPAMPLVGVKVGGNKAWGLRETTCRSTVDLSGHGTPGSTVNLLLDGTPVGSTLVDNNGSFFAPMQLPDGSHEFAAVSDGTSNTLATGKITVDRSLPIDPLSLSFTDSKGNTFHPSTLGFAWGESNPAAFLRSGETYTVGIDSCTSDPNMRVDVSIIGVLIALFDDNDDGRYTGSYTYNPVARIAAATTSETVRFTVRNGGTVQTSRWN